MFYSVCIDQYCSDKGDFIIEYPDNLELLLEKALNKSFTVYTVKVNISDFPYRVIAKI